MAAQNKIFLLQLISLALVVSCFAARVNPPAVRDGIISDEPHLKQPDDSRQGRFIVSDDFEDGTLGAWYDESNGNVRWNVESYNAPAEVGHPAPTPTSGSKYVRAIRNAALESGSVFLKSQPFTASPGDTVSFSFWIRSYRPEANNLELLMLQGNSETLLIRLSQYSSVSNNVWRTVDPISIPVSASNTTIQLMFYGYCGSYAEDAIAVDNIAIARSCGAEFVGGLSGTFTSPGYPNNYVDDLYCPYTIQVAANRQIYLNFSYFSTESNYDYVTVYDGLTTNSPVLLRRSGSSIPGPVRSSSYEMLVLFTTDGSNVFRGFSATYTAY